MCYHHLIPCEIKKLKRKKKKLPNVLVIVKKEASQNVNGQNLLKNAIKVLTYQQKKKKKQCIHKKKQNLPSAHFLT